MSFEDENSYGRIEREKGGLYMKRAKDSNNQTDEPEAKRKNEAAPEQQREREQEN